MVRFQFKKGLRFQQLNLVWTLIRRTATGKLQFESEDSEERLLLDEHEVYQRWMHRNWLVDETSLGLGRDLLYLATPKDFNALPEAQRLAVERRLAYLVAITKRASEQQGCVTCDSGELKALIKEVAEARSERKPPHWTTVWRWWKNYERTRCAIKLEDRRSSNHRKANAVHFSIFEEVVHEVFLTPQKVPGKEVVDGVLERIARMNKGLEQHQQITPPSPASVYRWLGKLYREVVDQAREGKAHTERELRLATGTVKVKKLLERVEIDHTPLDLLVVCEVTRLVLGRPWLTLVIDRFSRMILGFYISFHAPSAYSVLYALRMSILPKQGLLDGIEGLKNPWPARGLPRLIAVDNGMDLHADAVDKFCLEAGIEILFCGAAHPELKGAIERMMRTINHDLIHRLPGTVFHNPEARGDYPSEKTAAIDINQLTKIIVKWIVDVYHCTPHRGLMGHTPLQVWQEHEPRGEFELPAYPHQLDLIVGQIAVRTIFHYGIEYDGLRYNSTALGEHARRSSDRQKVQIRVYEHDVSYVDVMLPNSSDFVRIPAVDSEYCEGISRHTHRLIRQQVRARFGDEWTQQHLRDTKAEIQQMIQAAMHEHKAAKRKKAASDKLRDSDAALGLRAKKALNSATEPVDLGIEPDVILHSSAVLLPSLSISEQPRSTP